MKKFILTAVAAGALAAGGAASAQVFGGYYGGTPSQPAVVAGTQYSEVYPGVVPSSPYGEPEQIYVDAQGRRFILDRWGRQVFIQASGYDQYGRPVYGATAYNAPVYGANRAWDRDGDGVANARDRWPDDPRYR